MLSISKSQMSHLSQLRNDDFTCRAIAFVELSFAGFTSGTDRTVLADAVRVAIDRATSHGFDSEQHVMQYLVIMICLGARFDEDPSFAVWRIVLDARQQASAQTRMHILITMTDDWLAGTHAVVL